MWLIVLYSEEVTHTHTRDDTALQPVIGEDGEENNEAAK